MSTFFDTGHAKNVANLDKLNQLITTFGASYNPINPRISSTALQTLHTSASSILTNVYNALTSWKDKTNDREVAFIDLTKLATKLLGALESSGASEQTIADFRFLVRKMRGDGKLTKADAGIAPNPNAPPSEDNGNSNSQQSFDNKLQHFNQMILLLRNEPLYTPNEPDYQITALQTRLANVTTLNTAANASYANLKSARISRNSAFYAKDTGMLDLVKQSKAYIKSLFGSTSQQYKAARAIKFFRVIKRNQAV
jgi:hypothetical protein